MDTELNINILKFTKCNLTPDVEKVIFNYGSHIIRLIYQDGTEQALDFSQSHKLWCEYRNQLLIDAQKRGLVQ